MNRAMVAHAFSPSTWEAGGFLRVQGRPGLHFKFYPDSAWGKEMGVWEIK